jgi:phage baseplate assembly protein W
MSFDFQLVDSDLKVKSDGTVRTVYNVDKLKQDIIKMILTPIGSIRLHPWYGSAIDESIIGQPISDNMMFEEIKSSIEQSLDRLRRLQIAQASGQSVSTSELIGVIEGVLIQRSTYDMRQINVIVSVWSKNLSKVEESFSVQ